ncbi:MAG: accessory gene regulator B family protein [Clostridiaceae bacterium]|jgi:accessory gene regulator B|nr:accessory gene regulator B family protein [Clostridiaceae bacterium]
MLQRLSEQFTDFLLMKEIIENENREIYEYGLVALFSTAINIIVVLTIGIIAGLILESMFFILMFGVIRIYSGGYHAESHISCVLIFVGFYCASMAVAKFLPVEMGNVFSLSAGIISFAIILYLAPVEHKNKPFIEGEQRKFQILSRAIASVEFMGICLITVFFYEAMKAAVIISLAMLCVAFTLILAKATEIRR